jgi:phosphoesterase RecJ-like protein
MNSTNGAVPAYEKYRPETPLREALGGGGRVVLTAHVDPDPDGLGSVLGLAHILRREGFEALPVCIGQLPSFAPGLPGAEFIIQFPSRIEAGETVEPNLRAGDILVVMDTPTASRLVAFYDVHREILPSCRVVVFDHHYTNDLYGDVNYLDPTAAATAEVVCDVLDAAGIALDRGGATGFMTALLADTQCFRTENTTARSLLLGHRLAMEGAPIFPITEMLFKTRPLAGLRLWGKALAQMGSRDGIVWAAVTQDMLGEANATMEEAEGLVDLLLSTKDTRVAIVFKEARPGETKVSMRTVPGVDATHIVGVFGGGGHQRAAGATIFGSPVEAVQQVLPLVLEELQAVAVVA